MNSTIVIKKFGGTSVGSVDRIQQVAQRIQKDLNQGQKVIVVASAMSGETNRLSKLAEEINSEEKGLAYDMLLSSGEQVSVSLLSLALKKMDIEAVPLLAYQVGIRTNSLFSEARIEHIKTDLVKKYLDQGKVPLIAGFQGVNQDNQITTLGRGGSDTTAVALAVALGQKHCEIYTDVPNIYTADPSIIKDAKKISQLSFEEMMEMAILGAKVLHFRCVELAAKYNVNIHLRSAFEETEGTLVTQEEKNMENPVISSVVQDTDIAIVKLFPIPMGVEFISKIFNLLAEKSIMIDVISQSYNSEGQRLALSIREKDISDVKKILSSFIEENKISFIQKVCKVSIIGVGMIHHSGVAAQFFNILNKSKANLHLVTTSDIKISAIIDQKNMKTVIEDLHNHFCSE